MINATQQQDKCNWQQFAAVGLPWQPLRRQKLVAGLVAGRVWLGLPLDLSIRGTNTEYYVWIV